MNDAQIAVLMTCHNRRDLTLRCLKSLRDQPHFAPQNLFLVDDGSRDGTGEAVMDVLPGANVIRSDGSLFWNGGMRLAWATALQSSRRFDFFLWLNDDARLAQGALTMLLADADAAAPRGSPVIVAGATNEPGKPGEITYGGHVRVDPRRPLRLQLVKPAGKPVRVDTISGNIVLVSAAAEQRLGNIRPEFTHIYGDLDYGLRARAAGVPVVLASRTLGECAANRVHDALDPARSRIHRLRAIWQARRRVHTHDWDQFVRLHGGGPIQRAMHRVAPYLRAMINVPNLHAVTLVQMSGPQ